MTTTTKATKCIAVKTPFGLMYLESEMDGGIYVVSEESNEVYRKYLLLAGYGCLSFVGYDDQFIKTEHPFSGKFAGLLAITSNYGDQFPNG